MAKGITLQEIDSTATSCLVIKDSAGRAKVSDPSAADDIALKRTVNNAVGTLSSLLTTDKSNVVKAINELFTNVSNGKTSIAAAITGKGVPALGSDTFAQLAAKIGQIVTGKRWASGTISLVQESFLTVNALDFEPKFILVDIQTNTAYRRAYISGGHLGFNSSIYDFTGQAIELYYGEWTITSSGFTTRGVYYGSGQATTYKWFAFE